MKFYPPLGSKTHWITQTYHGESASNPNDLSKQCAIDLSAVGGAPVYAVADGIINNATTSYGSYCSLDIGEAFNVLYVHTINWLPKGTRVKRGQKIAEIKPMTGSHLHFGLKNKTGKAPHAQPMDYMPRDIKYDTRYTSIKAIWWKNGSINWSLFKDLQVGSPDCSAEIQKAVESTTATWSKKLSDEQEAHKKTQKLLVEVNADKKALESQFAQLNVEYQLCKERNEKLEKDLQDYTKLLREANERIQALEEKNSQLTKDNIELSEKLRDCQGDGQPSGCAVPLAYMTNKLSSLLNGDTIPLTMEEGGGKGKDLGAADKLPS